MAEARRQDAVANLSRSNTSASPFSKCKTSRWITPVSTFSAWRPRSLEQTEPTSVTANSTKSSKRSLARIALETGANFDCAAIIFTARHRTCARIRLDKDPALPLWGANSSSEHSSWSKGGGLEAMIRPRCVRNPWEDMGPNIGSSTSAEQRTSRRGNTKASPLGSAVLAGDSVDNPPEREDHVTAPQSSSKTETNAWLYSSEAQTTTPLEARHVLYCTSPTTAYSPAGTIQRPPSLAPWA
mmetsp:Transcript_23108/g.80179  ORF Transcript_23108/g.80179 Transcript_23108/m.80179 type:complete len:241 (+) Transcript_23108:1115-1837(+)